MPRLDEETTQQSIQETFMWCSCGLTLTTAVNVEDYVGFWLLELIHLGFCF